MFLNGMKQEKQLLDICLHLFITTDAMMILLSAILFSLIFGQVSAILQQAQKNTAKYHSILDNMKQFSKLYKLPSDLATRTLDFFMSTWAMNKGIDTDEVP